MNASNWPVWLQIVMAVLAVPPAVLAILVIADRFPKIPRGTGLLSALFLLTISASILLIGRWPSQQSQPPGHLRQPRAAVTQPFIVITSHEDGQSVPLLLIIRGNVFSNEADVWVIVHPMETEGYWVQPKAAVKSNGEWYSQIFIGREGKEDSGKYFEVMAVANPDRPLARDDVLHGWPEAEARSVVELIRE